MRCRHRSLFLKIYYKRGERKRIYVVCWCLWHGTDIIINFIQFFFHYEAKILVFLFRIWLVNDLIKIEYYTAKAFILLHFTFHFHSHFHILFEYYHHYYSYYPFCFGCLDDTQQKKENNSKSNKKRRENENEIFLLFPSYLFIQSILPCF